MSIEITLITTHGKYTLHPQKGETVLQALDRNQIPWTAVNFYARKFGSCDFKIFPCLEKRIDDLDDIEELHIYYQRNINPFTFSRNIVEIEKASEDGIPVTEYLYSIAEEGKPATTIIKTLSSNECRQAVNRSVDDTLKKHLPKSEGKNKIIVGISGGGDSNALIHALINYKHQADIDIIPVIICGIGEWDKGVPRAQKICNELELNLRIIAEQETRKIMGAKLEGPPLVDRFAKNFGNDDFEFLGTLLIRRCLAYVAVETGAKIICTGINLEDALAEFFSRLLRGKENLPTPLREIGELKLITPLWLTPKKIIDGCFPKLSLENYQQRYPSYAEGRTLCYQLAYWLTAEFPSVGEKILHCVSTYKSPSDTGFIFDPELGFEVTEAIPLPLKEKFKKLLSAR